jgi:tetratricopeptide (TPR) repeat protein
VTSALDDAFSGSGGVVWVSGEAGIGKTSLLADAGRHAAAAGATVLTAAGWDDPGTPPLWLWTQVLRSAAAGRPPAALLEAWGPRAQPAIGLVDPASAGIASGVGLSGTPGRFPVHDAIAAVVEDLVRTGPVVVLLDDLHWADADSLRALAFVAQTAPHRRLAVLVGWRDHELGADSEVHRIAAELAAGAVRVPLAGLDTDAVRTLLAQTTGADVEPAQADRIAQRTRGNPLFVGELGRLVKDRGDRLAEGAIPDTAQAVIRRRLGRLSQPTHDVLAVVAVAGTAATWATVAEVAGLDADALGDAVDEAVTAGLAETVGARVAVAHPLIRDVVVGAVPAATARRLHLSVADVLRRRVEEDPGLVAQVAHHLVSALPLGSADQAADFLGRASTAALAAGALDEAVAHARTAIDVVKGSVPRFSLLLVLGEALRAAGDIEGSREAYTGAAALARAADDAGGLARAALGYAAGLSGFEVRLLDRAQLELLDEALERLPDEDSTERADLLGRLSVATAFTDRAAQQRPLAEESLAMARRLGEPRTLARALAAHCDAIAGPDDAEARVAEASEVVAIAERVGDLPMLLLGLRLRVVAHLERGDDASADADMREFARAAGELGQPLYSWFVPLWRGFRAQRDGDVATMEAAADEAETLGARAGSRNAVTLALVLRLWVAGLRGRLGEALPAVDPVDLPEIAPDGNDLMVHLHESRPPAVRARALTRLEETVARLPRDSEYLSNLCHFATMLFEAGDPPEHARVVLEALRPHAGRFAIDGIAAGTHGSVHRLVGAMQLLVGDADAAVDSLQRASEANAGAPVPLMWTDRMAAIAHARRDGPGDAERARTLAARALERAGRLGLPLVPHPGLDPLLVPADRGAATGASTGASTGPASWRKEGDGWRVEFRGRVATLRDSKGTADLRELLARPGAEIHCLDLMTRDAGRGSRPPGTADDLAAAAPGDLGEVLDEQARRSYRARLDALGEEAADADARGDLAAAERARSEREAIVAGLAAAYGLGGRARRTGDLAERARTAVTWRIRDAIRRAEAVHPELGRHLRASVRTGTFCSYAPEEDPHWLL